VANYYPTPDVLTYGRAVSAAVGGKPFVVDTSRNGYGRPAGDTVNGAPSFCNPPGRALGVVPTTKTGEASVDAYLWIKRVGESDGVCRPVSPRPGSGGRTTPWRWCRSRRRGTLRP
jgi:endoglucanase